MASLPNSPAKKAKGKTPLRGGIVAKNKTLLAAGPEEWEAKSSRAAKNTASQIKPPSSGASVVRTLLCCNKILTNLLNGHRHGSCRYLLRSVLICALVCSQLITQLTIVIVVWIALGS